MILKARKPDNTAYKSAVYLALAAALLIVGINLAVGIIVTEDNPANLIYIGVLAVGIIGAVIARFLPHGMVRAMFATAHGRRIDPHARDLIRNRGHRPVPRDGD